jgi:hypothetical protein
MNRTVRKKELQRSSYLWRSGYIPRESGSIIERNKYWNQPNFESDDKYKSSSKSNNIGGKSNQLHQSRNLKIKIENLCQLAQKQLDNVIEDLLPKYGLVLHLSHPHFVQEYLILADIQRRQNERVDIQAEHKKKILNTSLMHWQGSTDL